MEGGNTETLMAESGDFGEDEHDFNLGLVVCLGKKASKEFENGGHGF